ncbi:unnamed protein product [Leptidea sinapis]|uniref:Uncharacterized protein n=1 Tax=Leptidea sinapis TaxID=189913 RepID=A0A5E4QMG5_9NEOP|nr:unnamed protein product [Leptidea sinapis]
MFMCIVVYCENCLENSLVYAAVHNWLQGPFTMMNQEIMCEEYITDDQYEEVEEQVIGMQHLEEVGSEEVILPGMASEEERFPWVWWRTTQTEERPDDGNRSRCR